MGCDVCCHMGTDGHVLACGTPFLPQTLSPKTTLHVTPTPCRQAVLCMRPARRAPRRGALQLFPLGHPMGRQIGGGQVRQQDRCTHWRRQRWPRCWPLWRRRQGWRGGWEVWGRRWEGWNWGTRGCGGWQQLALCSQEDEAFLIALMPSASICCKSLLHSLLLHLKHQL